MTKGHGSGETAVVQGEVATYANQVLSSRVFLSAFFSWFFAQLIKMFVDQLRGRTHGSRDMIATLLWRTGGMPSSHSSLVVGLATTIGVLHGVRSAIFALSFFYGGLIIRDALGVRRSAGVQARELNRIGMQLAKRYDITFEPVKEVNGHTPSEVFVGVLLGFFTGLAFSLL